MTNRKKKSTFKRSLREQLIISQFVSINKRLTDNKKAYKWTVCLVFKTENEYASQPICFNYIFQDALAIFNLKYRTIIS